jgi:hypothetical protein
MDGFADQLDVFRRHMTEDAHYQLAQLQQLDAALSEVDQQLLDYLNGMFRRHGERRSGLIMRLVEEARRYELPSYPEKQGEERPGVAQGGNLARPRFLGGGEMQEAPAAQDEASDAPENWNGFRGPYEGWRQ